LSVTVVFTVVAPQFDALLAKHVYKIFPTSQLQKATKLSTAASEKEAADVEKLIKDAKDNVELFALATRLRKGKVPGYPKDSNEAALTAKRCYDILLSKAYETDELHHNMGVVFETLKQFAEDPQQKMDFRKKAIEHFAKSSLPQSKEALTRMSAAEASTAKVNTCAAK
jgi:hypothetical protein